MLTAVTPRRQQTVLKMRSGRGVHSHLPLHMQGRISRLVGQLQVAASDPAAHPSSDTASAPSSRRVLQCWCGRERRVQEGERRGVRGVCGGGK